MGKSHSCCIHKERTTFEKCEDCGLWFCSDCLIIHGKVAVAHTLVGEDHVLMEFAPLIKELKEAQISSEVNILELARAQSKPLCTA